MTQTTTAPTAGETFTARLNRLANIEQDTPSHRPVRGRGKNRPLESVVARALAIVEDAAGGSPYYTDRSRAELRPGTVAVRGWIKHVDGGRLRAWQLAYLRGLSPWQVTEMLGRIADAGAACVGDVERWFAEQHAEHIRVWTAQAAPLQP